MKITVKGIIIIFVSIGVYTILDLATGIATPFGDIHITYAHPFLVFISAVAGPITGAITGFVGQMIVQTRKTYLDWPATITIVLNCLSIGIFTLRMRIKEGIFEGKDFMQFNQVQIISNILSWAVIHPLLSHFLLKQDLARALREGGYTALHYVISCTLISSLFIAIYARSQITPQNFYRN